MGILVLATSRMLLCCIKIDIWTVEKGKRKIIIRQRLPSEEGEFDLHFVLSGAKAERTSIFTWASCGKTQV